MPHSHGKFQRMTWDHFSHRHEEDRGCQGKTDPEAALHFHQFRINPFFLGYGSRLQGHSADGARTRLVSNNFRVHRARIRSSGGRAWSLHRFQHHPTLWARLGAWLHNLRMHWAGVGMRFVGGLRLRAMRRNFR